jgi:hypothetical protein
MTLDSDLNITARWKKEPDSTQWVMGRGSTLYRIQEECTLIREDLDTGEATVMLEGASGLYFSDIKPHGVSLSYFHTDLGAHQVAFLDFSRGLIRQPFHGNFQRGQYAKGQWLCTQYRDQRDFRVGNGTTAYDGSIQEGIIDLLPEGYLLEQNGDGEHLYLYQTDGTFVAGCTYQEGSDYLTGVELQWCPPLGGYLFRLWNDKTQQMELLLWTLVEDAKHHDLPLTSVDLTVTLEEALQTQKNRAHTLGDTYGLKIHIGKDCPTDYDDFTASHLPYPDSIEEHLDILEKALAVYPKDFFYQLRYDFYEQIHLYLVYNLTAKPHYGTGSSYGGFTQPKDGYYIMVINCDYGGEGIYYHEFSHIIDDYLQWDAWQREDALYSEEHWCSLNPEGFDYTYDYAVAHSLIEDWNHYFIDDYATHFPTEDRARILEYSMLPGSEWMFQGRQGIVEKLRYYSQCIRDGFDTTGWEEVLPWEQYLP